MNILEEDAYELSFATQGEQALSLIQQILLDIMMPGLDGFEVCRRIKQNQQHKDIPIIFLTARSYIDSLSQGFALGVVTI